VIAAGRCISTDGDAWEIFRTIPAAAMTGEAAGTAAALSIETRKFFSELSVKKLQEELQKQKFLLHCDEL